MTYQAEIGSYEKGIKFEKDSLQVLKFSDSSLRVYTVPINILKVRTKSSGGISVHPTALTTDF